VPCSGDGTLRKNAGIWAKWTPMDGNGLHSSVPRPRPPSPTNNAFRDSLQLRILQRALALLAPGGTLVYSTCSLNPVENEAVLAQALLSPAGATCALRDVAARLPGLARRPGLSSWAPSAGGRDVACDVGWDAYAKQGEAKLSRGHWPPSAEDAERLHLERACVA
jgi:multisite-specific tRNA:(cytosine-C5)-methyltransferase